MRAVATGVRTARPLGEGREGSRPTRGAATTGARTGRDPALLAGLGVIVVGAAALRFPNLQGHLPQLVGVDEPTSVGKALAILDGDRTPADFGWPPASWYLLAAVIGSARLVAPSLVETDAGTYLLGRHLFVVVALVVVTLTGLLAARLADEPRPAEVLRPTGEPRSTGDGAGGQRSGLGRTGRRTAAWGSAAAVAVSYLSVRTSRSVHPEHLQVAAVLGSLLCTLGFDRSRRLRWLCAAGALAGVAGGTKYLGVAAALPAGLSVVWGPWRPARSARHLVVLGASVVVGFLAVAPGAVTDFPAFRTGLASQLGHQAGGHLGYDQSSPTWWFHLTRSGPGNWGWAMTALCVLGVGWALVRGTRAQRLLVSLVVPVAVVVGLSKVRFPHYVLLLVPLLAPLGVVAATRLARPLGRRATPAVLVVLAVALAPTLLHDIRLLRTDAGPDTRLLATATVAEVVGAVPGRAVPVWSEAYGVAGRVDRQVFAFGSQPEVLGCDCVAVVSSYQEERFRRRPDRYDAEVAVYDEMRQQGRVLAVVGPPEHLRYDWDLLPQWGMGKVPITGRAWPTGPTVTVVDLRT